MNTVHLLKGSDTMTTEGTNGDFSGRVEAPDRDEVWRRWTTPATWGSWDAGLQSAEIDGPFTAGATGVITGLDGRRSAFAVVAVEPGREVRWEVPLPLRSRMALTRTLAGGYAEHRVQFLGAGAKIWAAVLGRRFRPLMRPTMLALVSPARSNGPILPAMSESPPAVEVPGEHRD